MDMPTHESSEEGSVRCRNSFREVTCKSVRRLRLECYGLQSMPPKPAFEAGTDSAYIPNFFWANRMYASKCKGPASTAAMQAGSGEENSGVTQASQDPGPSSSFRLKHPPVFGEAVEPRAPGCMLGAHQRSRKSLRARRIGNR